MSLPHSNDDVVVVEEFPQKIFPTDPGNDDSANSDLLSDLGKGTLDEKLNVPSLDLDNFEQMSELGKATLEEIFGERNLSLKKNYVPLGTGGCLTEIQLIEIVFYQLIETLLIS
jgi:hypothetical protein